MNKILLLLFTIVIITMNGALAIEDTLSPQDESPNSSEEVTLTLQLLPDHPFSPTDHFSGPNEISLKVGQQLNIVINSYTDDSNHIWLTSPKDDDPDYIEVETLKNPWTWSGWKQWGHDYLCGDNPVLVQGDISYGRTTSIPFTARNSGVTVIPLEEKMPLINTTGSSYTITVTVTD
jgi:hypothetical protein